MCPYRSFGIPEIEGYKELEEETKELLLQDLIVELLSSLSDPDDVDKPNRLEPIEGEDSGSVGSEPVSPSPKRIRSLSSKAHFQTEEPQRRKTSRTRGISTSAVSIIIDDYHNADKSTIRLVHAILAHSKVPESLIIVASTNSARSDDKKKLDYMSYKSFKDVTCTEIIMEPLTDSEISSLIFHELKVHNVAPEVMRKVLESCKGIPGAALTFLDTLKKLGILIIDTNTGICHVKDIEGLERYVSDDLKGKASKDYESIDKRSKYILQLVSVLRDWSAMPSQLLMEMYVKGIGKSEENFVDENHPLVDSAADDEVTTERDAIIQRYRKVGFNKRLADLKEAKVITISSEGKVSISNIAMTMIAYETCLNSTRFNAHNYVIKWYEEKCTLAGIWMNSVLLYHQCLAVESYGEAATYLYLACKVYLKKKKYFECLQLLKNAENFLELWSDAVHHFGGGGGGGSGSGSGSGGINSSISHNQISTPQVSYKGRSGTTGHRQSLSMRQRTHRGSTSMRDGHGFDAKNDVTSDQLQAIVNGTMPESVVSKTSQLPVLSIISTNIVYKKGRQDRSKMRNIHFCEMMCRFFESQVYAELKYYRKSAMLLKSIMKFCEGEGVRLKSKRSLGGFGFGCLGKGKRSKVTAAAEKPTHEVTKKEIKALYNNVKNVSVAINRLIKAQETEGVMLNDITSNNGNFAFLPDNKDYNAMKKTSFTSAKMKVRAISGSRTGRFIGLPFMMRRSINKGLGLSRNHTEDCRTETHSVVEFKIESMSSVTTTGRST